MIAAFLTDLLLTTSVLTSVAAATMPALGTWRPKQTNQRSPSNLTQEQIDATLKGLGINPTTPLSSNPDIAAALANYAAAGQTVAKVLNDNEIANYTVGFNNWAANYMAGRTPANGYPFPPLGYQAVQASDGWVYVVMGTDPVCAVPPLPVLPTLPAGMVTVVGTRQNGSSIFSAAGSANVPAGFTFHTTSADGVVGSFEWLANPFGGVWQQVA